MARARLRHSLRRPRAFFAPSPFLDLSIDPKLPGPLGLCGQFGPRRRAASDAPAPPLAGSHSGDLSTRGLARGRKAHLVVRALVGRFRERRDCRRQHRRAIAASPAQEQAISLTLRYTASITEIGSTKAIQAPKGARPELRRKKPPQDPMAFFRHRLPAAESDDP